MKNSLIVTALAFFFGLQALNAQVAPKEKKGDRFFAQYSFAKAIEYYAAADGLSIQAQRNLAEAYKNVGNYRKSEETYAGFLNHPEVNAEDFYKYACILQLNGKYAESKSWFERFRQLKPDDLRAQSHADYPTRIDELLKSGGNFTIRNLDVNTENQDFGPAFFNEKVVFASTREGLKSIKRSYNWNQKPFLDIYVADVKDGQLVNPVNFSRTLNKKMHEGPACFAKQGTVMAFTRNNYTGKSEDGVVKLEIFFSTFKDSLWSKEEAFVLNNKEYSVGHPWLSEDGNTMIFASDMPGGFGGSDLYRIAKDAQGVWGKPENLGNKVNTEGNEMFPFYDTKDELLFFASNGHLGLGGLDVYCMPMRGGNQGKLVNFGTPLNSQYDDFAFILDKEGRKGYFSSNRADGKGDDDIYAFDMLKPLQFSKFIKGTAKDKDGNVLANVQVVLTDANGKELARVTTTENGQYKFEVEGESTFHLQGTLPTYSEDKSDVSTVGEASEFNADLTLAKEPELYLYCQVKDRATGEPIEGASIRYTNMRLGQVDSLNTPSTGDFTKSLKEYQVGDSLSIQLLLEKPGYLAKTYTYTKVLDHPGRHDMSQELSIALDKIDIGADLSKLININPIYFDLNKFSIRKDAAVELDKIVKVMNENPSMVIELGSHTDCRGSIASNEKLSDNRAKASAAYIKEKISNPDRIYGKGYGESKLKNGCACEGAVKSTCTEEEHQQNRRTEFIIKKM